MSLFLNETFPFQFFDDSVNLMYLKTVNKIEKENLKLPFVNEKDEENEYILMKIYNLY